MIRWRGYSCLPIHRHIHPKMFDQLARQPVVDGAGIVGEGQGEWLAFGLDVDDEAVALGKGRKAARAAGGALGPLAASCGRLGGHGPRFVEARAFDETTSRITCRRPGAGIAWRPPRQAFCLKRAVSLETAGPRVALSSLSRSL